MTSHFVKLISINKVKYELVFKNSSMFEKQVDGVDKYSRTHNILMDVQRFQQAILGRFSTLVIGFIKIL